MADYFEVQTRDESGELRFFNSLAEAFEYADVTATVWKVSFPVQDGSRARFVRDGVKAWRYEPILS